MPLPTGLYANRSKDGFSTLMGLSKTLCRIVGAFSGIIRSKWADVPEVLAWLDAVEAICPLVISAEAETADYYLTGRNTDIDGDGEQTYSGRLPDAIDPTP
jgi:hypothetical protein